MADKVGEPNSPQTPLSVVPASNSEIEGASSEASGGQLRASRGSELEAEKPHWIDDRAWDIPANSLESLKSLTENFEQLLKPLSHPAAQNQVLLFFFV